MSRTPLRTPLYNDHVSRKARMVPFGGYEMPVQYTGVLDEARACRQSMALFDVSHMGQFSLRGKDPLAALQGLVTNDLSKIALGQAQYNLLCNPEGGVIDDLIIYRRAEDWTYICVNAGNRLEDLAWMTEKLPKHLSLVDESLETGLIAIQGPQAEKLITSLSEPGAADTKYYWARELKVMGIPVYLSRTGYTGEDGFELYVAAENTEELWRGLLEAGASSGLIPAGLGARDTLRLEAGYPLHGHELSKTISPLEAGLGWVVKLTMPQDFIGKTALQRQATEGPGRLLKALVVEDRRIARQGYTLHDKAGTAIGEVTSGTHSPHIDKPIALAFIQRAHAGDPEVWVDVRGSKIPAHTVALPFVANRTKRLPRS